MPQPLLKAPPQVEVDATYEVTGDFDEMLEIDEFDDEPVAATMRELGPWVKQRGID